MRPNQYNLYQALTKTVEKLKTTDRYMWGNHGACNCGHLAQVVTDLSREDIHKYSMEKSGDWADKAIDYCPGSKWPVDHILGKMFELGLSNRDIVGLERLDHPLILKNMNIDRVLQKGSKEDVMDYISSWVDLIKKGDWPC